jgi:PBP1b-binding outer membrane lipoprotein LpoB
MKQVMRISMIALFLVFGAGCSEPTPPASPAEPAADVAPAAPQPEVAAPEPPPPQTAVPQAEIEKAAALHGVLHDTALSEDQKQEKADALMAANGWTEEAYQALLYDITADPPSRAAYVERTQPK